MKNRWKIDLGGFWASKPGSGTRRGAFGTRLGRAKAGSRAILGRPGLAKSGRETSKSEPGTVPRRPRARPERRRSACGATTTVRRVIGTIFHRFCLVARKLLCAKNVAPAIVLYTSHEVKTARARASKKLEKQGVSASKIEAGSVRGTQNRARAARFARQNAKKSREALRIFEKRPRAGQTKRPRAKKLAAKSARVPRALSHGATRTSGMMA